MIVLCLCCLSGVIKNNNNNNNNKIIIIKHLAYIWYTLPLQNLRKDSSMCQFRHSEWCFAVDFIQMADILTANFLL